MGTARETLALIIQADAQGAVRELERVGTTADRQMGRAKTSVDKWGLRLQTAGAGMVGFAAIAGRGLLSFAEQSAEAETQVIRLDNTLANQEQLAGSNRQAFLDLAAAIQDKTAADGDAIVGAEALLGQYGATEQQILALTPLVVDLSQKLGVDLDTAARAVGKSIAGNTGGLRRMGIDVDATAAKTDAFGATQDALASAVGGAAESIGQTMPAQLARLKNDLGDVAEGIGTGVIPVLERLVSPVRSAANAFGEMSPAAQKTTGSVAAVGVATVGAVGALSMMAGTVMRMRDRFTTTTTVGDVTTTSMTRFGKAAVGVGTILPVVGAAFALTSMEADKNRAAVESVTDAVMNNSAAWTDQTTSLAQALAPIHSLIDAYRDAKLAGDANAESIREQIDAQSHGLGQEISDDILDSIDRWVGSMSAGQQVTEEAAAAQKHFKDLLSSGTASEEDLAVARQEVVDLTGKEAAIQGELNSAIAEGRGETEEMTGALKDTADAIADAVDNMAEWLDLLYERRDLERDVAGSTRALFDAEDALIEALEELNTVSGDASSTQAEIAKAQRDAGAAADDLAAAVDDLAHSALEDYALKTYGARDATLSAKEQYDATIWTLGALQATIAPGSPMWNALEEHRRQIEAIPKDWNTTITVNGQQGLWLADGGGLHLPGITVRDALGGKGTAQGAAAAGQSFAGALGEGLDERESRSEIRQARRQYSRGEISKDELAAKLLARVQQRAEFRRSLAELTAEGEARFRADARRAGLSDAEIDQLVALAPEARHEPRVERPDTPSMRAGAGVAITVNVPPTVDKGRVGEEIVAAIKAFERRNGKSWRAR